MKEILTTIITCLVSFIGGGGLVALFNYLTNKNSAKQHSHESSVSEWKDLYDEMKLRLDAQEKENRKLRCEIYDLRKTVDSLSNELKNYKKYDSYINELEKYIEHLLHTCQSLMTEDAYKNIKNKKPIKEITTISDKIKR